MFSFFLDVTRILIPSFIVFQNNITIDFKVEPSMKLLLSYAVTIAALSQVPLMSKGKKSLFFKCSSLGFQLSGILSRREKSLLGMFLKTIALLTRRAADGEAVPALAPRKQLLPSSTSAGVRNRSPALRNGSVTMAGRGRTPVQLSSVLEQSPPSNDVCFGTAFWL